MSVLYKALQKAEKENEQRQAPRAGLDPDRLAESGAIRGFKTRRLNWRVIGMSMTGVFVVVMGVAYYLVTTGNMPTSQLAAVTPSPQSPPAQNPAAQVPVITQAAPGAPQAAATSVVVADGAAPAAPAVAAPAPVAATETPVAPAPPAAVVAEAQKPAPSAETTPSTQASVSKPAVVVAAAAPTASARRPMPEIAPDSPARMLSPPIAVKREDYALAGVGNAIRVREVAASAQSDVRSGYTALINGQYDTALGFYESASKAEPSSVLALLGRGAAYQKLGREDEARAAYDAALKIDPQNREALTNVTGIIAQRQPDEALKRLLDMEAQYRNFSPIVAQIGMTYAKMGNSEGAVEYLRRAVELTPDAPMYRFNLAIIFDRAGQREQAIASYKQVLELMDGRNVPGLSRVDIQRRVEFLTVQH